MITGVVAEPVQEVNAQLLGIGDDAALPNRALCASCLEAAEPDKVEG